MFKVFSGKTSSSSTSCSLRVVIAVWLSISTTGLALLCSSFLFSGSLLRFALLLPVCEFTHNGTRLLLFLDQVHSVSASIPGGETGSSGEDVRSFLSSFSSFFFIFRPQQQQQDRSTVARGTCSVTRRTLAHNNWIRHTVLTISLFPTFTLILTVCSRFLISPLLPLHHSFPPSRQDNVLHHVPRKRLLWNGKR